MARGNPSPVSRLGRPNKVTKTVKEETMKAFIKKGGYKWILEQMDTNPTAVMSLLGKMVPKSVDLTADLTGDMQITTIQRTIVRPDK